MSPLERIALVRSSDQAASPVVALGDAPLTIDGVISLATGASRPSLSDGARKRMSESYEVIRGQLAQGRKIYGVTTGVGASVKTAVAPSASAELSLNLLRFHGCGTGRILDELESGAVLAIRLNVLAQGRSGVRPEVADRLATLLENRVMPCIPAEGSVGASGDLTPLSYVAAVLVGEREVRVGGKTVETSAALEAMGLEPLELGPKEALSLMNGTSVATALGCIAWARARRLARLSAVLTAMTSEAVSGNPEHFDAFLAEVNPFPGQATVADWIRQDLGPTTGVAPARLQDRYSIRCAPHIVGVLVDALTWSGDILQTAVNGVSDNPVIDAAAGRIIHGGNFYGGHVGFALDATKTAVANIADLLDRQLMLLNNPAENGGLPENLVGVAGPAAATHHGFKAMSITASALTAEALKLTMPASAFSRSTEGHNQDKVPMATTAARDMLRIVELTEQVAAVVTLACCQALDLRASGARETRAHQLLAAVRERAPYVSADRRMDHDIAAVLELLRSDSLPLGDLSLSGAGA